MNHCPSETAPENNPAETAGRPAGCGIVRIAGPGPRLQFWGDRVDVNKVTRDHQTCHDEHPMLVMRHCYQPRGRREYRRDRFIFAPAQPFLLVLRASTSRCPIENAALKQA